MIIFLCILAVVFFGLFIAGWMRAERFRNEAVELQAKVFEMEEEAKRYRKYYDEESLKIQNEAKSRIAEATAKTDLMLLEIGKEREGLRRDYNTEYQRLQKQAEQAVREAQELIDQQSERLRSESERVKQHYEAEARKAVDEANQQVLKTSQTYEPLRKFEGLQNAEAEAQRLLATAFTEATSLQQEAKALLEQSRTAALQERSQASQRAKEIREQADALLDRATRDAGRMVEEAHKRAEQIGGDAYMALREKENLERAVKAIQNVVDGYGDRYIIPTHSLLDDLAADFSHTEAGHALLATREQERRMIEERQAAECDYAETYRRETAIRFVIDAFNGRVESILSRSKHDNYGTLAKRFVMLSPWSTRTGKPSVMHAFCPRIWMFDWQS